MIRAFWIWLTYWRVVCGVCNGTGICASPHLRAWPWPHSCCGDCGRKLIPIAETPANFGGVAANVRRKQLTAMIGDGIMWRRPWASRQVRRPDR